MTTTELHIQAYEVHHRNGVRLIVREEDDKGMGTSLLSVDISYVARFGSDNKEASVNWSAIGSVDADTTRLYSAMLGRAAALAESLRAANGALLPAGQDEWHKVELWGGAYHG